MPRAGCGPMTRVDRLAVAAGRLSRRRWMAPGVDRQQFYRDGWAGAARELGITVEDLGGGFLRESATPARTLFHGPVVGIETVAVWELAGDKETARGALVARDVPVPRSSRHCPSSTALFRSLAESGEDCVLKPSKDTGGGNGVTVGPIGRVTRLRAVCEAAALASELTCEERHSGPVVRVLVLDGEVLDAVERTPARLVGDGKSTVIELVRRENRRRAALGDRSTGFLATGADFVAALARQGLNARDVPERGTSVTAAGRSNSGSERESRRVEISADVADAATRASAALGVRLSGVDVVAPGASLDVVLEVNTTPGLHWHTLVEGAPYDVFGQIMRRVVGR